MVINVVVNIVETRTNKSACRGFLLDLTTRGTYDQQTTELEFTFGADTIKAQLGEPSKLWGEGLVQWDFENHKPGIDQTIILAPVED